MSEGVMMWQAWGLLATGLGLGVLVGWHVRDASARDQVIDLERRYAKDLGQLRNAAKRVGDLVCRTEVKR
jgi:hypothetical protein